MKGVLQKFSWSSKTEISPKTTYGYLIGMATFILLIRCRSYFTANNAKIVVRSVLSIADAKKKTDKGSAAKEAEDHSLNHYLALGLKTKGSGGTQSHTGSYVIDGPLLDGETVLVHAILLQEYDSKNPSSEVNAQITEIVANGSHTQNLSRLQGAVLTGTAQAHFPSKKVQLAFTEIKTQDGKAIPIRGIALDPETQTAGTPGQYSSGLGSRILGAVIEGTVNAADEIGMMKVIGNTAGNSDSFTSEELSRSAMEANQQAAKDLSQESSKSLRETQPTLHLDAGTPLLLRLADPQSSGAVR